MEAHRQDPENRIIGRHMEPLVRGICPLVNGLVCEQYSFAVSCCSGREADERRLYVLIFGGHRAGIEGGPEEELRREEDVGSK